MHILVKATHATICIALAILVPPLHAQQADGMFAFIDVNVVPMDSERVLTHQTVLVRDGNVAAIGPVGEQVLPQGVRSVQGRGRYLMPGLTDSHVHLLSKAELPLYLANGVTTVFNLNGLSAHLHWRAQVERGELLGPRIFSTGPIINEAQTPEQAVQQVDAIADAGYDAIKVYNRVGAVEYAALLGQARKRHLLLMGHVPRGPGFEEMLKQGQSIAHAEEILYTAFNTEKNDRFDTIVLDEARIPVIAQAIAQSGISVTLTLTCFHDIVRQATGLDAFLTQPNLRYLAPWVRAGLLPGVNRYHGRYSPADLAFLQQAYLFQKKLAKALAEAGVPLLTGTDATQIGPVAGFSLHQELSELVDAGLSPYQALRAATHNAASYFGENAKAGAVAVGQRADLLLVNGNPLQDVRNANRIEGVMVHGRWLAPSTLRAMRTGVANAHRQTAARLVVAFAKQPEKAAALLAEEDPFQLAAGPAIARFYHQRGAQALAALVTALRASDPRFGEDAVNNLAYGLLALRERSGAFVLFKRNVADFPQSPNAADSLGEAYIKSGEKHLGVEQYRRALQLDPHYVNAEAANKMVNSANQ